MFLPHFHHAPAVMQNGTRHVTKRQAHAHEEAGSCSERGAKKD